MEGMAASAAAESSSSSAIDVAEVSVLEESGSAQMESTIAEVVVAPAPVIEENTVQDKGAVNHKFENPLTVDPPKKKRGRPVKIPDKRGRYVRKPKGF